MEKALEILKSPTVAIGSESNFNLQDKAVVLFATREQIQEAISELEEAMNRTCESCKHWTPSWERKNFLNNKRLQNDLDIHIRSLKLEGIGICGQRSLENIEKEKHKNYGCIHHQLKDTQC